MIVVKKTLVRVGIATGAVAVVYRVVPSAARRALRHCHVMLVGSPHGQRCGPDCCGGTISSEAVDVAN